MDRNYRVMFIPVEEWKEGLRKFAPADEPATEPEELFSVGEMASGDFSSAVYDAQRTKLEGDKLNELDEVETEPFAVVPLEVDGKLYHCVYFK